MNKLSYIVTIMFGIFWALFGIYRQYLYWQATQEATGPIVTEYNSLFIIAGAVAVLVGAWGYHHLSLITKQEKARKVSVQSNEWVEEVPH